jgi:hypothetical protein
MMKPEPEPHVHFFEDFNIKVKGIELEPDLELHHFALPEPDLEPHQNDDALRVWLLLREGKMMRLQLFLFPSRVYCKNRKFHHFDPYLAK